MQFSKLKTLLKDFLVFSTRDIEKIDPKFHSQRLSEWQEKGYIKKLTKEYYIFSDLEINEPALFLIANKIYSPSYVSLEMALSYYNLIPEAVYGITSAGSRKTKNFKTELGEFIYRSIKPALMFGCKLIEYKNHHFKIAEIEKALLDYFYINPRFRADKDFFELRFNADEFKAQANSKILKKYLDAFKSKGLEKRIKNFLKFIDYAWFKTNRKLLPKKPARF